MQDKADAAGRALTRWMEGPSSMSKTHLVPRELSIYTFPVMCEWQCVGGAMSIRDRTRCSLSQSATKAYNGAAMTDETDAERLGFTWCVNEAYGRCSSSGVPLIMIHNHKGRLPIVCRHQSVPQVQILHWQACLPNYNTKLTHFPGCAA